jgi:large subunit ribosomal protein L1
MPNPKLGTVTPNVEEAVRLAKAGQVEYRAEKAGIVQAGIGKASFTESQLKENLQALYDAVLKAKPSDVKNNYIKRLGVSSTMGVGLRVDVASIVG